jgi:hypothetical protein
MRVVYAVIIEKTRELQKNERKIIIDNKKMSEKKDKTAKN